MFENKSMSFLNRMTTSKSDFCFAKLFQITVFPQIVSALEQFPPLNSFRTFMHCDQRVPKVTVHKAKFKTEQFLRKLFVDIQYSKQLMSKQIQFMKTLTHCAKMEMNEEKLSKFQFHFPVLLVPYLMKKKLSEKSFVFGLSR